MTATGRVDEVIVFVVVTQPVHRSMLISAFWGKIEKVVSPKQDIAAT